MQYTFVKAALLALAATTSVLAQATEGFQPIQKPALGDVVTAGETYTIEWEATEPVTALNIVLLQGSSNITLQIGETIKEGVLSSEGKYEWAVPKTAGTYKLYGIKLEQVSDPAIYQYSQPFEIKPAATTKTVQVSQVSTETSTSLSTSTSSSSTSSSSSKSSVSSSSSSVANSTSVVVVVTTSDADSSTSSAATSAPTSNVTFTTSSVTRTPTGTTAPTATQTGGAVIKTASGMLGAAAFAFAILL